MLILWSKFFYLIPHQVMDFKTSDLRVSPFVNGRSFFTHIFWLSFDANFIKADVP